MHDALDDVPVEDENVPATQAVHDALDDMPVEDENVPAGQTPVHDAEFVWPAAVLNVPGAHMPEQVPFCAKVPAAHHSTERA